MFDSLFLIIIYWSLCWSLLFDPYYLITFCLIIIFDHYFWSIEFLNRFLNRIEPNHRFLTIEPKEGGVLSRRPISHRTKSLFRIIFVWVITFEPIIFDHYFDQPFSILMPSNRFLFHHYFDRLPSILIFDYFCLNLSFDHFCLIIIFDHYYWWLFWSLFLIIIFDHFCLIIHFWSLFLFFMFDHYFWFLFLIILMLWSLFLIIICWSLFLILIFDNFCLIIIFDHLLFDH